MSLLSKPATTTTLLAINAVLLLDLVIQNATKSSIPHLPMTAEAPFHGEGNPHDSMPMGQDGNFDPTLMIMAALNCPGQSGVTLDSPNCNGGKAEDMRASVHDIY